jgi:hypothetical protein
MNRYMTIKNEYIVSKRDTLILSKFDTEYHQKLIPIKYQLMSDTT